MSKKNSNDKNDKVRSSGGASLNMKFSYNSLNRPAGKFFLIFFNLLIFEGFPNRVLVYPDRGGLQIMLMICTNKCW